MTLLAKDLKIAFYVYPTAFQNPGGGEVQLLKTKEYLQKLGVQVTLFDPWKDRLENFDLLHTFGSVKEALPMMEVAHRRKVPNILSTICWYNWQSAWGTYSGIKPRLASVARHAAKQFFPWVPSPRKRMMEISDFLLPNSLSEAEQLSKFFCVSPKKIAVVHNAVDSHFVDATPDLFLNEYKMKDFVLCVGRIEPRKNQLNMVRAFKNTSVNLVFIGKPVSGYEAYFNQCRNEATSNIHFLGEMTHESGLLKSAYAACKVFLLASWLETPGLAALEAGLAGAQVVITREGATREYFGEDAGYVSPANLNEIKVVTLDYLSRKRIRGLSDKILQNYTWERTALQTLAVYQSALNRT